MVARTAPLHHRVLGRHSFHIVARQVVEQDVELGGKQLAIALPQMLFQLRLVRQDPIQAALQPRVIIVLNDAQYVTQGRGREPPLFDCQFVARGAQLVDGP
jgi:hypothetical protein